jgi:hypothetical protein
MPPRHPCLILPMCLCFCPFILVGLQQQLASRAAGGRASRVGLQQQQAAALAGAADAAAQPPGGSHHDSGDTPCSSSSSCRLMGWEWKVWNPDLGCQAGLFFCTCCMSGVLQCCAVLVLCWLPQTHLCRELISCMAAAVAAGWGSTVLGKAKPRQWSHTPGAGCSKRLLGLQ